MQNEVEVPAIAFNIINGSNTKRLYLKGGKRLELYKIILLIS